MLEQPAIFTYFISAGMGLAFYIVLFFFTIYTIFLAYHWYSYGTNRATSTLALAVYLLGSVPFFTIMAIMI